MPNTGLRLQVLQKYPLAKKPIWLLKTSLPGQVHPLENPGVIPLEVIEVQSGSYLGVDDTLRLKDRYGRV